ncbi:hypothetical protein [Streptomyces parvus]|uniref:imine reductase family protein n=1 Tax=Streptomyces parvus TaxID=66428 RepID=UPI003D74D4D1
MAGRRSDAHGPGARGSPPTAGHALTALSRSSVRSPVHRRARLLVRHTRLRRQLDQRVQPVVGGQEGGGGRVERRGKGETHGNLDAGHCPGDFGTGKMNLNALEHTALTCEEQGVHAGQPRLMRDIAAQTVADGHGGSNHLAVFEVFRKAAGRSW